MSSPRPDTGRGFPHQRRHERGDVVTEPRIHPGDTRKATRPKGARQFQNRNERTTKDLRKQIEQARPIQLNRPG